MTPRRTRVAEESLPPARRRWFQWIAAGGAPIVLILLIELGLRLFGVGYPTGFLLPSSNHGKPTWIQNNKFTWRFFGPRLSRRPFAISIPRPKEPGTIRVFVFGESAAFGDPQPQFGLPRMLQTILSLRHPGAKFEVINAGITAINSHVIRDIAHDCAGAGGDVWVIYMGNNEVVGPFGAGTIFGRKTPPLPFIRATLALKATRLGQLFDSARPWFQPAGPVAEEWGGMGMFLNYQVRATDPRMEKIYDYYAQNLNDIIDFGRRAGTGIVVSSVAVNLKDCAPFASEHRAGLSTSEEEAWDRFWQDGIGAQAHGQTAIAVEKFRAAAGIDDSFAELRFRQGECALAQHDAGEAQRQFQAARDLDTLRFRCDSTLNDLARRIAAQRAGERVLFTDAERIFGEQSDDGLPGNNFFYEHVHLNFEGNYLLARSIARQVEKLIAQESGAAWPALEDCKRRLGWTDYDRLEAIRQIADRMGAPPFTGQCHHEAQMKALDALLENLAAAAQPAGILASENACRAAQAIAPNDPGLDSQMAALAAATGDFPQAIVAQKRSLDAIPSDAAGWANLGLYLMSQKQFFDAPPALQHAIELDPVDASLTKDFAHALWKAGRLAESEAAYHKALKAQPERAITWLDYGRFLEETGRKPEASNCYAKAVLGRGKTGADFVALAHFCESRSWFAAASSNYLSAIRLEPVDPKLRVDAGGNYALSGDNPRAEEQFRQALRLEPGLVKTRLNLAVALMKEGRAPAARRELDLVLQQEPGNAVAAQYAAMLRSNSIPAPSQP